VSQLWESEVSSSKQKTLERLYQFSYKKMLAHGFSRKDKSQMAQVRACKTLVPIYCTILCHSPEYLLYNTVSQPRIFTVQYCDTAQNIYRTILCHSPEYLLYSTVSQPRIFTLQYCVTAQNNVHIVACRGIAMQRPRIKQLYSIRC
jgi:hypothetical protein